MKKKLDKTVVIKIVVIVVLVVAILVGIYCLTREKVSLSPVGGSCVDTDSPTKNYTMRGSLFVIKNETYNFSRTDYCIIENNTLAEWYCKDATYNGYKLEKINCSLMYGADAKCISGACVSGVMPYLNNNIFTIYISTKGNDKNYGFTKDKPVYNLSRAQEILKDLRPDKDVEIRIAPGVYHNQANIAWTYYNSNHLLRFLPSGYELSKGPLQKVQMPVFDGNNSGRFAYIFFDLQTAKSVGENTNVEFYGLDIRNYEGLGIRFYGSTDLSATQIPTSGWNGNNKIIGCIFENLGNYWGGGIGGLGAIEALNSRNNLFEYNQFYNILNNASCGTCSKKPGEDHIIYLGSGSSDNIFSNNRIRNIDSSSLKVRNQANDNVFENNVFENIKTNVSIFADASQYSFPCTDSSSGTCFECASWDNVLENNRIYNYSGDLIYIRGLTDERGVRSSCQSDFERDPSGRLSYSEDNVLLCNSSYFKVSMNAINDAIGVYSPGVDWANPAISACCPNASDCVDSNGNCYAAGVGGNLNSLYGIDKGLNPGGNDNIAYCWANGKYNGAGGTWLDCDKTYTYCASAAVCGEADGRVGSGEATPFGEYTSFGQQGCCGDDPGEFYVTVCAAGVSNCTPRCCASPDKVIDGEGLCIAPGNSGDGGNSGGGGGEVTNRDCIGNWTCGDWSDCVGNVQTRECANLEPACRAGREPARNQSCVVDIGQGGNATDNTQTNYTEQGSNGGSGILESNLNTVIATVVIIAVLIILGIWMLFRFLKRKD